MIKQNFSKFLMTLTIISTHTLAAQGYRHDSLVVRIRAAVIKTESTYEYNYIVVNDSASQQRMETIYVESGDIGTEWGGTIDTLFNPTNKNWEASTKILSVPPRSPSNRGIIGWFEADTISSLDELYNPTPNLLLQGESIQIGLRSQGLPAVKRFWAGGWTPPLTKQIVDSLHALGYPDSVIFKPWYQDAFTSKTLSPVAAPIPFHALTFLDTITSYINQSRTLGWIANQTTANKYKRLVATARFHLQANNRGVTKAKLDSVLLNVYPDTTAGTLTSEAYALIRFNTEYLMKKLREEDSTFAAENKSSSSDATATNNGRHLAKSEGFLHELFVSGGEIFYRRSPDDGSSWDQTHRLNTEVGENSHACITVGETGTIQVVWQRKVGAAVYEVWHAYSQDRGESWSTPTILPGAGAVQVSQYQPDGAMPVVAERRAGSPVVVYCSRGGLRYRTSGDDGVSWQVPTPDSITGKHTDRVRSPSVVGDGSVLSLVYDAGDEDSPWSRTYDGSVWSDERSVGKETGTPYGVSSSIAIDADIKRVAAWSAAHDWSRSIVFRLGYPDNTWSSWFVEFWGGQLSPDWLNPSLTYYDRNGHYGIAIVHHTTGDAVKLIVYDDGGGIQAPTWEISTVSETGRWAHITQESSGSGIPVYCWTDQGAFPHEIMLGSSGLSAMKGRGTAIETMTHTRRAVVHHRTLGATLSLEVEPLKIALSTGDTTVVRFKRSSLRQPSITFGNMWEYLGSDTIRLPANARRLVIAKRFGERGPSIAQRKFYLHLLNRNGTPLAVLDSTATSGTVSVNVAPYAGRDVIVRPQVVLVGIVPQSVEIGVGDVYVVPEPQSKSGKGKTKKK